LLARTVLFHRSQLVIDAVALVIASEELLRSETRPGNLLVGITLFADKNNRSNRAICG